jgi:hypothetical protein
MRPAGSFQNPSHCLQNACGTPLEVRLRILRLFVQAAELIVQAIEAEITVTEGQGEVLCRAMDLGSDK